MSQPGWYPDPDPTAPAGRLRWWSGAEWGAATTAGPGQHAPFPGGGPTGSPREPRRGRGPLVVVVAVLVLGLLAGFWWHRSRSGAAAEDTNTAAPTVSAWNESSPTPSAGSSVPAATSPSSTGSASPGTTPSSATPSAAQATSQATTKATAVTNTTPACPNGSSSTAHAATNSGLTGGGLSASMPSEFIPLVESYFGRFVTDRSAAVLPDTAAPTGSNWLSFVVMGRVDATTFGSLQQTAHAVVACHVTSGNFRKVSGEKVTADESTTLDGGAAWHFVDTVSSAGVPGGGATYEVEVVDMGSGSYGVWWTGGLLDDPLALQALAKSRSTLKIGS